MTGSTVTFVVVVLTNCWLVPFTEAIIGTIPKPNKPAFTNFLFNIVFTFRLKQCRPRGCGFLQIQHRKKERNYMEIGREISLQVTDGVRTFGLFIFLRNS